MSDSKIRTYKRTESCVFLKTNEAWGALSNMAGGFTLQINGNPILTTEALYQACRFPHRPDVQQIIIDERSPMAAKMVSKPHRKESRKDWEQIKVKIMRWCLRVKLAQNWEKFGDVLLMTDDKPIVEESRKDDFWGAKAIDDQTLVGQNVLGRLLMELREEYKKPNNLHLLQVEPLAIPDFLLYGKPITAITGIVKVPLMFELGSGLAQASLFDAPQINEPPAVYKDKKMNALQIANLKPYSEYKVSGANWLGKIPAHWELRPAFGAYQPNREKNIGMKEKTVLSLSYGRIVIKPPEKLHGLVPESFDTYQIVNPGDIIIRTTDLQNDHTSLRVAITKNRGIITSAYLALHAQAGVMPEYGYQFLNVWDLTKAIYGFGSGLRQGLDFRHFKRMPVALPPPAEQAAIIRFINYANNRLERAIRAKRKVIALLNEQKQAIIHKAVTRGLDPNVKLKDSGIPWLGEIPEHWEVLPLGRILKERIEKNDPVKTDNILSLSLHDGVVPYAEKRAGGNKAKDDLTAYKLAYPGDIVVNSMNVVVGSVGLSKYFGVVSPVYYMLRPRIQSDSVEFFDAIFHDPAFQRSLFGLGNGIMFIQSRSTGKLNTIRMRIPMGKLNRVEIPYPPANEQVMIVRAINAETIQLDFAITRLEREIELLKEYKTRLVADVVTGKLDVREAAASLPDEEILEEAVVMQEALEDETEASDDEVAA